VGLVAGERGRLKGSREAEESAAFRAPRPGRPAPTPPRAERRAEIPATRRTGIIWYQRGWHESARATSRAADDEFPRRRASTGTVVELLPGRDARSLQAAGRRRRGVIISSITGMRHRRRGPHRLRRRQGGRDQPGRDGRPQELAPDRNRVNAVQPRVDHVPRRGGDSFQRANPEEPFRRLRGRTVPVRPPRLDAGSRRRVASCCRAGRVLGSTGAGAKHRGWWTAASNYRAPRRFPCGGAQVTEHEPGPRRRARGRSPAGCKSGAESVASPDGRGP